MGEQVRARGRARRGERRQRGAKLGAWSCRRLEKERRARSVAKIAGYVRSVRATSGHPTPHPPLIIKPRRGGGHDAGRAPHCEALPQRPHALPTPVVGGDGAQTRCAVRRRARRRRRRGRRCGSTAVGRGCLPSSSRGHRALRRGASAPRHPLCARASLPTSGRPGQAPPPPLPPPPSDPSAHTRTEDAPGSRRGAVRTVRSSRARRCRPASRGGGALVGGARRSSSSGRRPAKRGGGWCVLGADEGARPARGTGITRAVGAMAGPGQRACQPIGRWKFVLHILSDDLFTFCRTASPHAQHDGLSSHEVLWRHHVRSLMPW